MNRIERVNRWLTAAAVTLGPLLVLVLPAVVVPAADFTDAEEQARALATTGFPYRTLVLQIAGAIFLVPAVLGVAGTVFRRGRGVVLGLVSLLVGMVAAFALLLLLGYELATAFVLSHGSDTEAKVALAVAMGRSPVFVALLTVGFAGFFVALPILAVALWRSRVVPIAVPLLFLLPVLIGFVPLPAAAGHLVPSFGVLLPCVWITVQLLRQPPPAPSTQPEPVPPAAAPEGRLSPSEASR